MLTTINCRNYTATLSFTKRECYSHGHSESHTPAQIKTPRLIIAGQFFTSNPATIQVLMHVTIRMAWHDNAWDGAICQNPEANSYCVGTHSLLSGRIEKNRDLKFEKDNPTAKLPTLSVDEIPPCYWSINAFGNSATSIQHTHVFSWLNIPAIPDTLEPHTVYTWPFKLSFVHDEKNKKKHGNYPPDLEKRIQDFIAKFTPRESIIFFYANYDNPVSADDMKYLLLGCSVLASKPETTEFKIETDKLKRIRSKPKTRNFPTMNWALKFKHDP